jgi:hypothetical protein
MIVLNESRTSPQAHGIIVAAFHPVVFGYHIYIYPKGRHGVKDSNRDMIDKIT